MFLIREIKKEDINKICEIMLAFPDFYPEFYVNSTKRGGIKWLLRYAVKSNDKYDVKSYVIEEDGQIVGHIAYLKDICCFQGGIYDIRALAVDANKTGNDYGKILLRHIKNELKKIKARMLFLQTSKDSYKFYLRQGYVLEHIIKNYWGKGSDRYILKLQILDVG